MTLLTGMTLLTRLTVLTMGWEQQGQWGQCGPQHQEAMMPKLFDKHGGFRKLHTFTLAMIVQVETLRFCRRFLTFDHRDAGAKFCVLADNDQRTPG